MSNQNFTNFTLKTPASGDFLVGYNADGSSEFRTTVNTLLDTIRWKRYNVTVSLCAGQLPTSFNPFVHYVLGNTAATFGIVLPEEPPQGSVIRLENTSTQSVHVSWYNPMAELDYPIPFTILSGSQTATFLYTTTYPLFLNAGGGSGGLETRWETIPNS